MAACLVYRRDAASGMPRLESQGIPLSPGERQRLEKEIGGLFEWLVTRGNGGTIALETPLADFEGSAEFLVRKAGGGRCPDLIFEPVAPHTPHLPSQPGSESASDSDAQAITRPLLEAAPSTDTAECDGHDWQSGFLAAVDRYVCETRTSELSLAERKALEYGVDMIYGRLAAQGQECRADGPNFV